MKRLSALAFLLGLLSLVAAGRQSPQLVNDAWSMWNSNSTTLWGANIYQVVDNDDRKQWAPLLLPHDFEDLQRAGANYVNFSVPGPFDPDSGDLNDDDWNHLKDRVQWAKAAKLKIVIAFRTAPGRNEADLGSPFTSSVKRDLLDDSASPNIAKFREMWRKVAKEFGNDPSVIGFDLLVEPHAPKKAKDDQYADFNYRSSNRWRDVAKQAIKAIRDEKIVMPILVEPDLWAAALYLNKTDPAGPMGEQAAWSMPEGDHLVCAIHQYHPSDYCEDGKIPFDIDFRALKEAFTEIGTWRSRNSKVPVCVNEFGVKQCLPYSELFLRKELRLLKEQNINHAVWLWQANDPATNHDFDVRYNRKILAELTANWKQNADDQGRPQPERPQKTGKWQRDPHSGRMDRGRPRTSTSELPAQMDSTTRGRPLLRDSSDECCPCDSAFYDPAFKLQLPVTDARVEFRRLSNHSSLDNRESRTLALKSSRRLRANLSAKQGTAPFVAEDDHSRAIGYWPKVDQLKFTNSTAIRHVIVFPDEVGGDFRSFLYQTSTNRSAKGTEAHIAFDAQKKVPEFWIFDWSLCNPQRIRQVPVSAMNKWVFPVRVDGFERKGVLVVNQTRLLEGTTWLNCVYLGVFKKGRLQRFDAVYSNTYTLKNNDEQQPNNDFGFWGPEIESFQDYKQGINEMGFSGCWMIQDGKYIPLDKSNTEPHDDGFGLKFYQPSGPRSFLVH